MLVVSFEGSPVVLLLDSLSSPTKIREELERMVLSDRLGSVGGPEEEIDEQSVRDRYFVGMLAFKSRMKSSPSPYPSRPLSWNWAGRIVEAAPIVRLRWSGQSDVGFKRPQFVW
ncbi:MAG: hypothetical protein ACLP7Q_22290 [Isosphaeraceae bacterium]